MAILVAFALLAAQGHALTVNIANLQRDRLAGTQSCAVGHRKRGLMLEVAGGSDQAGRVERDGRDAMVDPVQRVAAQILDGGRVTGSD
jgi:hypothetical protein